MSKKRLFLLVLSIALLLTTLSTLGIKIDTYAATSDFQILFNNTGNTVTSYNTINANFKLTNNSSSSINLADLKFRYYYTADSNTAQNFFCDHAGMLNGWSYTGVTDKVTGTFIKLSSPAQNADSYFEVGFKSDAGTLSAGGYIEIQTRVARNDWTNYDLSNDYSFKILKEYGENDKIAVYFNGSHIYGDDNGFQPPIITPTTATYDKFTNSDLSITIPPSGYSFKGIVGLTQNTDYVVSGDKIIINKEYLRRLPIGNVKLIFDFGVANNPQLTLTIIETVPQPIIDAIIGTAEGAPGDTVTVPISFKNVGRAGNVGSCNFYISYDNTLIDAISVTPGAIIPNAENNFTSSINKTSGEINFSFLDNTVGNEMIESDGDFALVTFKIRTDATATTTPIKFVEKAYAFPNLFVANTYDGSINIKPNLKPQISPTLTSINMSFIEDIKVTITPNGHVFNGVTGLTKGTDYTVSGNTVTILKSYLSTMAMGIKVLTFDFGVADNPVLKIEGFRPSLKLGIGTAEGHQGDVVTVPITISSIETIGGLGTFNFYIGYDRTQLEAIVVEPGDTIVNPNVNFSSRIDSTTGTISFVFLDNTLGNELITTDGAIANIKFKILGSDNVTLPIVFKNGSAFGNGQFQKINYMPLYNGSVTITRPLVLEPQISPSLVYFEYGSTDDIKITLTPNGNTFRGIVGLTEGVDYIVAGNEVTILNNYLNKMVIETKVLTFDFGLANPALRIELKFKPCVPPQVRIGNVKGALGDTVTVPITLSNVNTVGGIGTFNCYVAYDKTQLEALSVTPGNIIVNPDINSSFKIKPDTGTISFVFLDNTIGDELITTDGIVANITFKIIDTSNDTIPLLFKDGGAFGNGKFEKISDMQYVNGGITIDITNLLNVSVAQVTGNEGEIVSLPIGFENVSKLGNITSCDIKVNYDTNLLKAISIEPGSIVTNSGANFRGNISTTSGAISIQFNGSTENGQFINQDGVFAYINFKLNTPSMAKITSAVDITESAPFYNSNYAKVPFINKYGSVTIIRTTIPESKIEPSMTSFILGSKEDLKITLSPNGNTFIGILGLNNGTDYTISQNTVTIYRRYINKLQVGTTQLTFDFGIGDKNPVLEIAVKAGTPDVVTTYNIVEKDNLTNLAINIIPNGNPFNGIVGLKEGTDYTVSGNTVTILSDYLSKLPLETIELTLDFGVPANPVIKICVLEKRYPLYVKIGDVEGTKGEVVTVPVSLSNVRNAGNILTFNFYVDYDKTLLKAVAVEPGEIITNPYVNFSGKINATTGIISVVFLDFTTGDELISTDGIAANITFEILDNVSTSPTPIVFKDGGAFGDGQCVKISDIQYTNGSATILPINVQDPQINPLITSFVLGSTDNLIITLSPNWNVFNGISGLNKGSDYIVSENTVTILKSYLNNLEAGLKELTFDFGVGDKNPVLEITVTAGIPSITPNYQVIDKKVLTDLVININPNGNEFNGISGLTRDIDYTVSGNTLTVLKSYLNSLDHGDKTLTIDFGVTNNPVLRLKIFDSSVDDVLCVRAGEVSGKCGGTVTIPISFSNVSKVGNVGVCNFYLGYNSSKYNVVSIEAGDIITNAAINFASRVDSATGTISLIFLDNTLGCELIDKDGVFANITLKILSSNYNTTSSINFMEGGAFGDSTFTKIENVLTEDGSVHVY